MPQAPKTLDPSVSERHRFGAELRTARVAIGMSQAGLAKLAHVHPDLIAKVEKATRWPTESLAISCDAALGTTGKLAHLWPAVARERQEHKRRGPTSAVSDVECADLLEPIGEVAGRLWSLSEASTDAALSIVKIGIDDIVERYETGNPATLAVQAIALRKDLESMLEARPSASQRRKLLGLAGHASGLLAYMAVNLGRFPHADAYSTEAFSLAEEAGDQGLMAWVRGTQSFACYYRSDYSKAVEYARDGLAIAGDGPQRLRLRVNCEARALAFLPGRKRDAERAVARAYKDADQLDVPEGISPCIAFTPYSRGRVIANAITVFQTLEEVDQITDLVEGIEDTVRVSESSWSRSLIDLDHAATLLHRPAPRVEQAMHLASSALATSADRPITSVLKRGQALARSVAKYGTLSAVQEFQERLRLVVLANDQLRHSPLRSRALRSQG